MTRPRYKKDRRLKIFSSHVHLISTFFLSLIDRVMTLRKSETSSSPGSLHMSETDPKHWLVPTREEKLSGTWFLHFQFPLSQVHINVLFRTQYVKELALPIFTLEFFLINITMPNSWCSKLNPVHTLQNMHTKKFINWLPINIYLRKFLSYNKYKL